MKFSPPASRPRSTREISGDEQRGEFQGSHHHTCVEKQTKLDAGNRERQCDQTRSRTLVCHAGRKPQSRSSRSQPLSLYFAPQGSCSVDRRCSTTQSLEHRAASNSMMGEMRCHTLRRTRKHRLARGRRDATKNGGACNSSSPG